jgi:alkylresorcinol/alkylpyrone synthase
LGKLYRIQKTDFDCKLRQSETKRYSEILFGDIFQNIQKLLDVFDNSGIKTRNFCVPIDFFNKELSFEEKNILFKDIALEHSLKSIKQSLLNAGIGFSDITDFIYVNTTGLTTPSLDALVINSLKLNPNINRYPLWGLGCAGGVSGLAKANTIAKANPEAVIIILGVELCSLTFRKNDVSKSNFVATSLFSDGITTSIVLGDNAIRKYEELDYSVDIIGSQSKLYYDSEDVMGWEFLNDGFKVVFSKDIPTIIHDNVKGDVINFLDKHNLQLSDIKNFIAHPGGAKVIKAYIDALGMNTNMLNNSRYILENYGNMSSVSVLYVLERFISEGFEDGYGLMISLGPGFSSEMVLLDMKNNAKLIE